MPGVPFVKFAADVQDYPVDKKIAAVLFADEFGLTRLDGDALKLDNATAFSILRTGVPHNIVQTIMSELDAADHRQTITSELDAADHSPRAQCTVFNEDAARFLGFGRGVGRSADGITGDCLVGLLLGLVCQDVGRSDGASDQRRPEPDHVASATSARVTTSKMGNRKAGFMAGLMAESLPSFT
jgi:hypothetical protein